MKALHEMSVKKAIKFVVFGMIAILYHLFIDHILNFPQTRKLCLQLIGSRIGKNSILMSVKFFNWHHFGTKGLQVGNECFIGDDTLIDLYDRVILQDRVTIAQRVTILTHLNVGYKDHPLQKYFPKTSKPVFFEKGSVIGSGSIILPGITIGKESFVAAGSVVTKNVPKRTLVAGVPAKAIRKIIKVTPRVK